ncbi:MAG: cytochrome C oxidase subunit III [Nitratiruptor sp.]|nr:cytochrome C oxidase subunit III [Nitratiruptor sp.]NPA83884.1 cytochrome c [Campylobacterota bacterium]
MRALLLSLTLVGWGLAESFITKDEYAQMLYQNPRGIGCHKCHGVDGKGLELGRYRDGNRTIVIKAPDITGLSFERFKGAIRSNKNRLMPSYFLTDKEIKTLYYYLTHGQKEKR